jgi:uncharacterized RmlC-like cupin family protein
MAQSVRAKFGSVVRAGESYHGKQGLDYTPGVSAESVGSQAIWLGSVTLPPHGGRTKAHLHENHETALYLISGTETPMAFIAARTDPNEQESVVMRPDLESKVS